MTHGSLFSGIGGFDLAAQWMGWENKFHCEWNEFGQKVLNHYWPEAELFKDITKSDFTKYANTIDVLSGGFPCQPYSQAGKRLGKDDDRHLWPEMLRAIREIRPCYVVGENVRGLTNWNGGMVFDEVQADLEAEGYEVTPFLLPACAVNAPHRRDRIWFVAYLHNIRQPRFQCNSRKQDIKGETGRIKTFSEVSTTTNTNGAGSTNNSRADFRKEGEVWGQVKGDVLAEFSCNGNVANTTNEGLEGRKRRTSERERSTINSKPTITYTNSRRQSREEYGQEKPGRVTETSIPNDWSKFPTQSPLCIRNDGLSPELSGITFSKHRNESIKAYGNAVVPQVVYEIFKAIELFEKEKILL